MTLEEKQEQVGVEEHELAKMEVREAEGAEEGVEQRGREQMVEIVESDLLLWML